MKKNELAKYAGTRFYNLSSRMGGMFLDIHCLTVYQVTERGTCKYIAEVMGCVANKAQYEDLRILTDKCGYHAGRPTAKNLTVEFLERQRGIR